MRIFQNSGIYPTYLKRLNSLRQGQNSYSEYMATFLDDRYGGVHLLKPVLDGDPNAFFTNGDDEIAQRMWAREQGLSAQKSLEQILLAQIEHHRAEVLYNTDPLRYSGDLVRKLPGCVRRSFAWRAAPSPGANFGAYHGVLCNFPSILDSYRQKGWRGTYFLPAHDPVMDGYANRQDRPVDVVFVGGYTRHHRRRAELLEAVAGLSNEFHVHFHLDNSRMTRLAESPLGHLLPIRQHRRPENIRKIARPPVFGQDLYQVLSRAKIVLNGAIDMVGEDRGNMRCFEAMGCGALMVSDTGNYPKGMVDGENMITYRHPTEAVEHIRVLLKDEPLRQRLAQSGYGLMTTTYTKTAQWQSFVSIVDAS